MEQGDYSVGSLKQFFQISYNCLTFNVKILISFRNRSLLDSVHEINLTRREHLKFL